MSQITITQHTVPRKYLQAWASNNKIAARIGTDVKNSVPLKSIGQEKYFYEFKDLNYGEVLFVLDYLQKIMLVPSNIIKLHFAPRILPFVLKKILDETFDDDTQKIIDLLINRDLIPAHLLKILWLTIDMREKSNGVIDIANAPINGWIKNGEEPVNSCVERDAWLYLDNALIGDLSFFSDESSAEKFMLYMAHQLCRTKKSVLGAKAAFKKLIGIRGDNIFSYLRLPMIYNIHNGLCAKFNEYQLMEINNNTDLEFITGDQPILNLDRRNPAEFFHLYFPISPKRALLLCKKERAEKNYCNIDENDRDAVDSFNRLICNVSTREVYASNAQVLEANNYVAGMELCSGATRSL